MWAHERLWKTYTIWIKLNKSWNTKQEKYEVQNKKKRIKTQEIKKNKKKISKKKIWNIK